MMDDENSRHSPRSQVSSGSKKRTYGRFAGAPVVLKQVGVNVKKIKPN